MFEYHNLIADGIVANDATKFVALYFGRRNSHSARCCAHDFAAEICRDGGSRNVYGVSGLAGPPIRNAYLDRVKLLGGAFGGAVLPRLVSI